MNNVPDEIRRKFIFKQKPVVEHDESQGYQNVVFSPRRLDQQLFKKDIIRYSPEEMIYHINDFRAKARLAGRKMDIFDPDVVK